MFKTEKSRAILFISVIVIFMIAVIMFGMKLSFLASIGLIAIAIIIATIWWGIMYYIMNWITDGE